MLDYYAGNSYDEGDMDGGSSSSSTGARSGVIQVCTFTGCSCSTVAAVGVSTRLSGQASQQPAASSGPGQVEPIHTSY